MQAAEICHTLNHFLQIGQRDTEVLAQRGWHANYVEQIEFSHANVQRLAREIQNLRGNPSPQPPLRHPLRQQMEAAWQLAIAATGRNASVTVTCDPQLTFEFDATGRSAE